MTQIRMTTLFLLAALLTMGSVWASGGSSAPPNRTPEPVQTPEELAVEHYNRGLAHRDKAWKLEKELGSAGDEKQRQKLERKIAKQYDRAIHEFETAIQQNPRMHEAHGSLGYALRRSGRFEEALEAYDRALSLDPSYTEAIEYRAEAYLGLNRLEEAKSAYMQLFSSDRARADELLVAMQRWIEQRRQNPSGVEGSTVEEFAGWVSERAELAGVTTPVSELRDRSW